MCQDNNSASLSVRYLNSQLTALWQNATECMDSMAHDGAAQWDVKSDKYDRSKYTRALAQFHYYGKKAPKNATSADDFWFYAVFGRPEVKFVCNHDAVLFLTIEKGHANLEHTKAVASICGTRVEVTKNKPLQKVKLAYRLAFERTKVKGRDSRVGNADAKHLIQMMVLKFDTAQLIDLQSESTICYETREALKIYMVKYFDFLRRAGNHVLFDLPDFDDDKYKAKIDYSVLKDTLELEKFCQGVSVQSIDVSDINEHLAKKWAIAQRFAYIGAEDPFVTSLAAFTSQWLQDPSVDAHYFMEFRTPWVKALCGHEVILYLEIDRLWFFDGADFTTARRQHVENWTVAYIVDVVEHKEGSVTELRLNFETARISHLHSSQVKETALFNLLVDILNMEYFQILTAYSMHVMFHLDILAIGLGDISGGRRSLSDSEAGSADWSDTDSEDEHRGTVRVAGAGRASGSVSIFMSIISHMSLFGFDQITALSEEAMNDVFAAMFKTSQKTTADKRIDQWRCEGNFSATFGGITVRLLSGNRALVTVHVEGGSVYTKKDVREKDPFLNKPSIIRRITGFFSSSSEPEHAEERIKYDFGEVVLAFEVEIKMVDHETIDAPPFKTDFHKSELYTSMQGKVGQYRFKHILLDVHNARLVDDLSKTTAFTCDKLGIARLQVVQHHVADYLAHLAKNGHTVVQSLPFLAHPELDRESYAFTSINYQVISKTNITLANCNRSREAGEVPALLIYGMCGGRPMPSTLIQWLTAWIIPSTRTFTTCGTVCLSKEVFLEGRLLKLLEVVNRKTTLVPKFAGVIDGHAHFDLCAWNEDTYRKAKKCLWKPSNASEGCLEYIWEYRDEWSHGHQGTNEKSAEHSLVCSTRNKLIIPTAYRPNGELRITLEGESYVKVNGKSEGEKWNTKTSASWGVAIVVNTRPTGIHVSATITREPLVQVMTTEGTVASGVDIKTLHSKNMNLIDFKGIEKELNVLLAGAWQYSSSSRQSYALANPVFTRAGDLIVQLIDPKKSPVVVPAPVRPNPMFLTMEASRQLVQSAKIDLNATALLSVPSANGGHSSASSVTDSPPPKTPALEPTAPPFVPTSAKAAVANGATPANGTVKTASAVKPPVVAAVAEKK